MRMELQTHPKVVRILSAIRPHDVRGDTDKFRVIGGLHAVWCVFDQHSEDGVLHGYTPELLDHIIGWDGFAAAMINVGWMAYDGAETLTLPEFDEHNGKSAKRRAEDQKRKRESRSCPQSVRNLSASEADKLRTKSGLEKRREEVNPPTPRKRVDDVPAGFDEFWSAYPRKVSKPQALKAWRKLSPDTQALQAILAGIERDRRSEQWLRDGGQFIPHPATWLNGRRWEDEQPTLTSIDSPAVYVRPAWMAGVQA